MSRVLIVLRGLTDIARVISVIKKAPFGTRVEIKGAKRTLPQNDRMWAMLTDVSRQARHHGQRYTADQWKVIFLHAAGREVTFIPALDGSTFIPWGQSSSDLTVAEMTEVIECMFAWGAQNGIQWSDPTLVGAPRGISGPPARRAFLDAARAAAFTTESGRTIIHSFLGGIGADWDLDDVLREIAGADDVRWEPGLCGHDLRVTKGRRIYAFQVARPAAENAREAA